MQPVSLLYNRHPDSDIYIIGTGASMRAFPLSYLADKITIGINLAWKMLPVTYSITTRPELNIPEFIDEPSPDPDMPWIIKKIKLTTPEQKQFVEEHPQRFYNFNSNGQENTAPPNEPSTSGRMLEWVRAPIEDYLYLWASLSATAANLAANMGAKNIFLVGCDNGALGGNHHVGKQHTFWKGVDPNHRYDQYYQGLVEVRSVLRERGIHMFNLTPFVHLLDPARDFRYLCQELNVPDYIENPDISSALIPITPFNTETPQPNENISVPTQMSWVKSGFWDGLNQKLSRLIISKSKKLSEKLFTKSRCEARDAQMRSLYENK